MNARLFACLALILLVVSVLAEKQNPETASSPHSSAPTEFDSFMVVLLVRPPNAPEFPKAELDQLQEAHLTNIRRLAGEGKVFKAGPFEDYSGRNVRGMFILKTSSLEEARAWVATDPLVRRGRLVPEFLKWYVEKGSLK
ncbi:MAG TPA: YciI family protein [Chthoniobacterales bacterium]